MHTKRMARRSWWGGKNGVVAEREVEDGPSADDCFRSVYAGRSRCSEGAEGSGGAGGEDKGRGWRGGGGE